MGEGWHNFDSRQGKCCSYMTAGIAPHLFMEGLSGVGADLNRREVHLRVAHPLLHYPASAPPETPSKPGYCEQGQSMDPFGRFFEVMLRDMLGTIPGGEEFLTGLLGIAGRDSAAALPPFPSGGVHVAWSARTGRLCSKFDTRDALKVWSSALQSAAICLSPESRC